MNVYARMSLTCMYWWKTMMHNNILMIERFHDKQWLMTRNFREKKYILSKFRLEIASCWIWYMLNLYDHKLLTHFWKIILQRFLKFVVAYEGLICII